MALARLGVQVQGSREALNFDDYIFRYAFLVHLNDIFPFLSLSCVSHHTLIYTSGCAQRCCTATTTNLTRLA